MDAQTWQIYIATVKAYIGRSSGRSAGRSPPPSIEHRCLEYHYTKLGRSTLLLLKLIKADQVVDLPADLPPHQSSIDALTTVT